MLDSIRVEKGKREVKYVVREGTIEIEQEKFYHNFRSFSHTLSCLLSACISI